tara:strand:+ start:219 stop:1073 length:855 start_codon:yes stop_codon:yes gene_type:complete
LTTNKKANPAKSGNPKNGSDILKDRASGDNFFTALIKHIKTVPSTVEIGVLVFMTLLTNPQGSLVTYKETKKGRQVKLDGRSVSNFLDTYNIGVAMSEFMTGINMAIIANESGKLASAEFRSGSASSAQGHLDRLTWIRDNVVLIGAANQRLIKPWITSTANQVMSGKKLTANQTLEKVSKDLDGKKGDELSKVVAGLNKARKTAGKKTTEATAPVSAVVAARQAQDKVIHEETSIDETVKALAMTLGSAKKISDAEQFAQRLIRAIELAKVRAADPDKISTTA